jgi:predicted 2-oxoglutarate/Fe(II)-dependent dioxygenase YbiX
MIPIIQKPNIIWDIPSRIFTKDNVLSKEMCNDIIEFGKKNVTISENMAVKTFSTRFHACLIPIDHPVHTQLQETYSEVIDFFKFNISFVEQLELKKYESNDYFSIHTDTHYSITEPIDRKITLVVQISDAVEYNDGELEIFGRKANKQRGSVIAFPSFFTHKVNVITHGERWSLIAWMCGPYWR